MLECARMRSTLTSPNLGLKFVIWALVASFIIIVLPIWESKDQILAVFDGIFHTNLCEYYNPETSKQHKLHQAAAAAEPAKAADPAS